MLSDRKKKILCAVVDSYIDRATPISSNDIQQNYLAECSSATIRNELSALESMGYLIQPHVSAGRIPSEKAFRFYVDELSSTSPLTGEDFRIIQQYFGRRLSGMEEVVSSAARAISDITNYTSVVVKSDMSDRIRQYVRGFVQRQNVGGNSYRFPSAERRHSGNSRRFHRSTSFRSGTLAKQSVCGKARFEFINFNYPFALVNERFQQYNAVFRKIIDVLKKVSLENGMDMETYGENKIFQHSEYSNVESAKKFLQQMECKTQIAQLFTDDGGENGAVTIKIGSVDNAPEGCAVVTTRVALGDNVSGPSAS